MIIPGANCHSGNEAAVRHNRNQAGITMNSLFKNNAGKIDRIVRIIVGAVLIGNVFTGLQTPIGWLGVILVVTGLFGTCPVYSILGINTKSLGEKAGLK
jgi:hypothetical protein